MRTFLLAFILIFLCACFLFPENSDQVVVILPFINIGEQYHIDLDESLFVSYFYLYFEQLKNFRAVYPSKVLNYKAENLYNTEDLYSLEILNAVSEKFKCDFILGGEFKVEKNTLYVNIDIFGKQKKMIIQREYAAKIKTDIRDALLDLVIKITKNLSHHNPETASLVLDTEEECILFIDGVELGAAPGRFLLPAGKYIVELVYKDDVFSKSVFIEQVELKKGNLYNPGKIQVMVHCEITSNVQSEVYCDGKKIGNTDLDTKIPTGNEYVIDLVFTDAQNEKRYERKIISTKPGKDVTIHHTFPNRIIMKSGDIPLSGSINNGIKKLPFIFTDLESGVYRAKVLIEDTEWNREFIITRKKITLNIAQTVLMDKSDFVYKRYWGLCFLPSVAQFYNFEPLKASVVLTMSLVSIIETAVAGYFMIDYYHNTYLPAATPGGMGNDSFRQIQNTQNALAIATFGGLAVFCAIFTYSFLDGIITMNHIYDLIYRDQN